MFLLRVSLRGGEALHGTRLQWEPPHVLVVHQESEVARVLLEDVVCVDAPERVSLSRLRETHPAAYMPWTAVEESRLMQLVEQGLSVEAIAQITGRQPCGISSRIRRLGLAPHLR